MLGMHVFKKYTNFKSSSIVLVNLKSQILEVSLRPNLYDYNFVFGCLPR